MEGLWRGWQFTMISMKMRDMHYQPMIIHVFCLPLKILAGFVIPDAIWYNLIFNMLHKICLLISSPKSLPFKQFSVHNSPN